MSILSEKFRLKRKELGLSQQTLAEGICEQSQISKIERGHFIPSADLLFKLSQRLEVPLDYFFNEQIEIKSNLSNFKQLSARLLDDRNYDDLEYIYRIEIERSTFLTLEDRTYLEWIKAIIDFYQYDSKCEAISSLENILLKVSSNTLIYLKVLNTLSNFYSLVGREQEYQANYSHLMELYQTKILSIKSIYLATSEFVTTTLTTSCQRENITKPSKKLLRRLNSVNKDRQATNWLLYLFL